MSSHTAKQACQNIAAVKAELIKHLPGGEGNIKSIYIKSTDKLGVPIYVNTPEAVKDVKLENNMTPQRIKKAKKLSGKRLKRKKIQDERKKKRELQAAKASSERQLITEVKKTEEAATKKPKVTNKVVSENKKNVVDKKNAVPMVRKNAISKPVKPAAKAGKAVKTVVKTTKIIK